MKTKTTVEIIPFYFEKKLSLNLLKYFGRRSALTKWNNEAITKDFYVKITIAAALPFSANKFGASTPVTLRFKNRKNTIQSYLPFYINLLVCRQVWE